MELALSAETGEAERARALRLLGFDPATPLQALAIAVPAGEDVAYEPTSRVHIHGHRPPQVILLGRFLTSDSKDFRR